MKTFRKILSVLLAMVIVFSLGICAYASDKETVIASSDTASRIIVPAEYESYEYYAAETLQKYIDKMTGIKLSIVTDNIKFGGNRIYVGNTVYTNFDFTDKKDGSYRITSDENSVSICGIGNAGTVYGVYRFLEEYCNLHFYTKDVITIEHAESLSVPSDIDISYEPYFSARRLDTISATDTDFQVANSLNNGSAIPKKMGGSIPYLGGFCHTMTTNYCSSSAYFNEHPEYFALSGGKRVPDQLCLTNNEVLAIVTRDVLEVLRNQSDPNADLQILSVTQNDNNNYCQCESCKAFEAAHGGVQSATMINFVNQVARAVKAAGYDNVAIDTLAYRYTRQVPTNLVPDDNVIVRLCSIECCFGHTLEDEKCSENVEFMKDLNEWSKICKRLYVWDYVNNYSETICPFANFGVLQANLQTFYEHNVIGVYEEGNYYQAHCDGEFADLRTYMLSQFMENPYCDYDDVVNRFLEAYYGNGWENIREFIDIITEHSVTKNKHLDIRQQPKDALPRLGIKDVTRCDELWANAKNEAQDETYLKHIERSEICWTYWKCCNYKKEFSIFHTPYQFMKARDDLYHKLVDFGFTIVGEGSIKVLTDVPALYLLFPCNMWEAKHHNDFWYFISPMVEWIYQIFTSIHNFFS